MHLQARDFLNYVLRIFPEYFKDTIVLDVGSADINGNNRVMFTGDYKYIGNDVKEYTNVDIVCETGKLDLSDNHFDIIISSECFEHDMYYKDSLKNIVRMLKPDGLFTFTCASTGRPEHGTIKTTKVDSLTTQIDIKEWNTYYRNLTASDIKEVIDVDNIFSYYNFYYNRISNDLYFVGIKKGEKNISDIINYIAEGVTII